jgi:acetyl-CoA C-acetyltransferase
MPEAWLVGAARTPIGSFGGALADLPAPALGSHALRAALERARVPAEAVDQVVMGNVIGAGLGRRPRARRVSAPASRARTGRSR